MSIDGPKKFKFSRVPPTAALQSANPAPVSQSASRSHEVSRFLAGFSRPPEPSRRVILAVHSVVCWCAGRRVGWLQVCPAATVTHLTSLGILTSFPKDFCARNASTDHGECSDRSYSRWKFPCVRNFGRRKRKTAVPPIASWKSATLGLTLRFGWNLVIFCWSNVDSISCLSS